MNMDSRTQLLAVVGALLLGLNHALDKNTPAFGQLADKWRLLVTAVVGAAAAVVDSMVKGTALVPAIVTAFAVSGPSLVVLIVTAFANGIAGKPPGTGSIDLSARKSINPPAGPYSVKFASLPGALVAISCIAVMLSGCAFLQKAGPVISEAESYVADAQEILQAAEAISSLFFLSHPDPASQAKVVKAFSDAHLAIDAAVRATRGATELTQEQLDAAFHDFNVAYLDLESLLKNVGVAAPAPRGKLAMQRGGEIKLVEPLALGHASK